MPDPNSLARWLIVTGLALAGAGTLVWLLGRSGITLGRLPGDLRFSVGGASCFVPIATSLILSLLLTILLNLILRLLHK
jgi:Protein of unknown function (DUF2905)